MGSNPYCCELRCGVLSIGIVGIVYFVFSAVFVILTIFVGAGAFDDKPSEANVAVGLFYLFVAIVGLLVAISLTVGASAKKVILVQIAFGGRIFVLVLNGIVPILEILLVTVICIHRNYDASTRTAITIIIVTWVLMLLITIAVYADIIYCIYAYIKQFTRDSGRKNN